MNEIISVMIDIYNNSASSSSSIIIIIIDDSNINLEPS
jgi:hypothetical protein